MELRHLRYFAAVAAHGSFSRAANNLHLTQPALSRQVKDLEDELGVPLFVRGTNAATLTEAGEIFYEEARDLLARADQAIQRVRGEAKSEVLRVGYGPSLTSGIMPKALERFQAAVPRVRIELEDLAPKEIAEKVKAGLLDLVIAPASIENLVRGFQWSEIRRLSLVLVASKGHPLVKLAKVPPKRLKGLPLHGLGRVNFPDYVSWMRTVLKPHGVTPDFTVLVNDGVTTMFAGLEASNGATILTDGVAGVLPRSLEMRPFSPALPDVVIMAGLPADRPNVHAETFARLLREEAAKLKVRTPGPLRRPSNRRRYQLGMPQAGSPAGAMRTVCGDGSSARTRAEPLSKSVAAFSSACASGSQARLQIQAAARLTVGPLSAAAGRRAGRSRCAHP